MFEESNHRRVTQLVQALTYWLGDLCHITSAGKRYAAAAIARMVEG